MFSAVVNTWLGFFLNTEEKRCGNTSAFSEQYQRIRTSVCQGKTYSFSFQVCFPLVCKNVEWDGQVAEPLGIAQLSRLSSSLKGVSKDIRGRGI